MPFASLVERLQHGRGPDPLDQARGATRAIGKAAPEATASGGDIARRKMAVFRYIQAAAEA
jgi:hypothetical protein